MTEAADNVLVVMMDDRHRWSGYPSLVPLLVPIESIEAHPRNPRKGNLDVISRSLSDFGQTKPIIVQASTSYIVAGNHTRRAALEKNGWTHIAAVLVDMDDETARDYLVADNRSSDLGEYDSTALIELLQEAADRGRIVSTGYTADELDDLIAANDAVAETALAEFQGGYSETQDEIEERAAVRAAGEPMREIVLMYEPERHAQFARWVGICKREYGTSGTIDTVYEMARRAAEAANAGETSS